MFLMIFLVARLRGRLTFMKGPVVAEMNGFEFPVFLIAFFSNRNSSCPTASYKCFLV